MLIFLELIFLKFLWDSNTYLSNISSKSAKLWHSAKNACLSKRCFKSNTNWICSISFPFFRLLSQISAMRIFLLMSCISIFLNWFSVRMSFSSSYSWAKIIVYLIMLYISLSCWHPNILTIWLITLFYLQSILYIVPMLDNILKNLLLKFDKASLKYLWYYLLIVWRLKILCLNFLSVELMKS